MGNLIKELKDMGACSDVDVLPDPRTLETVGFMPDLEAHDWETRILRDMHPSYHNEMKCFFANDATPRSTQQQQAGLNDTFRTLLHSYCHRSDPVDPAIVKKIISKGTPVNALDVNGKTAAHLFMDRHRVKGKDIMPTLNVLHMSNADLNVRATND